MKLNEIQNNPNWYLVLSFIKSTLFDQFNEGHIPSWELTDTEDNPVNTEIYTYQVILPHLLEHKFVGIYLQMDDTDHPRIDTESATSHEELLKVYDPEDFDGDITEGHCIATDINGTFYHIAFILD